VYQSSLGLRVIQKKKRSSDLREVGVELDGPAAAAQALHQHLPRRIRPSATRAAARDKWLAFGVQRYLAHKKPPPPLGPP